MNIWNENENFLIIYLNEYSNNTQLLWLYIKHSSMGSDGAVTGDTIFNF